MVKKSCCCLPKRSFIKRALFHCVTVYTFPSPELEIHQNKGFLDKDVLLLTLEDPKARIGSGGATINALLVVTEHLSAKAGYEVKFKALYIIYFQPFICHSFLEVMT